MKLGIDFDAERDDVFHSHGYAKIAYGPNLGSASPVPGGGRAGSGDMVGTYRNAGVPNRRGNDPTLNDPPKEAPPADTDNNPRSKLQVKSREGDEKGAAFSHRDLSTAPIRAFREPPGRSYNPYT